MWFDGKVHLGTPKSSVERSVPLIGMVAEKLEVHMRGVESGGLIWTAPRGGYVLRLNVRDGWWGMVLGESGIPRVTPHELCHAAVSLVVQSGADVRAVQRMLGYVSAAMTLDVYADLFGDDLDVLA